MFGYEAAEEGAVDAAGDVVTGGDGEEGAGVVVEAYGVVEASGFGGPARGNASCRVQIARRFGGRGRFEPEQLLAPDEEFRSANGG